MRHAMKLLSVSMLVVGAMGYHAQAQESDAYEITQSSSNATFRIFGGAQHLIETDIADESNFDVTRVYGGVAAQFIASDELSIGANIRIGYSSYNFSGSTGFGTLNPWDDVLFVRGGVSANYALSKDVALLAGGIFEIAGDPGADVGDSITGGGFAAVSYQLSHDMTIGGGLGVTSSIADRAKVFPIIIFDWQLATNWRISTTYAELASNFQGLELIWEGGNGLSAAAGFGYSDRRFRLDDSSTVPDGVGEETSMPLWVRATYEPDAQTLLSLYFALPLEGEITVTSNAGVVLSRQDFEANLVVGGLISFRF
jgi:hypothetical protein